jgi:hypothetical protein
MRFLCLRRADKLAILCVIVAALGFLTVSASGWNWTFRNSGFGPGWQCSSGPHPVCFKEPEDPKKPATR